MWLVTIGRHHLNTKVIQTFVNGKLVYDQFNEDSFGMAIDFDNKEV
jgi:hypothetical protein